MSGHLTVRPHLQALITEDREGEDYWLTGVWDVQAEDLARDAKRHIRGSSGAVLVTIIRDENVSEVRIDPEHGVNIRQTLEDVRDAIDKALLLAQRLGRDYAVDAGQTDRWWTTNPADR